MLNKLSAFTLSTLLFTPLISNAAGNEQVVEIMLADKLDEFRGYCLDIAGGKGKNAPLDKGLQAHTCYNYTGVVLEDQGFVEQELANGQFRIAYFDVCMTASELKQGAKLLLDKCEGNLLQKFTLNSNGQLSIDNAPHLCVTVDGTQKREGRGGSPVHVMRPLSLQPCAGDQGKYQTWSQHKL